ncbi:MAG: PAS domain S-box protein [Thermoanaerobaculia bacterium]
MVSESDGDQLYALEGAEHPFRLFFEAMNEGTLVVAADGLVLFCNRRFARMLNSSVEALVGRNIDAIANPEVRKCLSTLTATGATRCDPAELQVEVDGQVRTLSFEASSLSQSAGMAILVIDVTESRERTAALASRIEEARQARLAALNMMEDAVEAARSLEHANRNLQLQVVETKRSDEAHRRLATVVEQAAETIVITDLDGTIVYVNPAFERISGYTEEEAIGQNPGILASGKHTAEFYQQLWATIGAGGVWHGHFTNRRKDGGLYDEEATISPVRDASGTIINYVAIKRDVSAVIALEEQLRHAQKIEAIGTLAGGVAHDFNNLLQAMLSVVQLLKRKSVEPRDVAHLTQLEKTIRRGSSLTQQLLLFARRETSKSATLDLNHLLRDLRDFFHRITPANIHLSIEPANAPCWISADRGQVEQVVMNLAVNAIDAMPEGGALSIATGCDDHTAWLEVSDTGTGIPQTIRDRIFEPFFTTKEPGKGTGLGLSVAYGIVTAHAGTIGVDCPAGGGTVFRVELPLQSVAVHPSPAPLEEELPSGSGERVLLVEDDPAAREGLAGLLEILGYAVVAVGSGEEALGIDGAVPFSVVLSDYMLPGIPGIEVVCGLRERWPDIKAILMSGYAPQGTIEAAVAAKEVRFLQKPFDMAALGRTLSDVLHPSDNPDRP